jgi:hypothetical protein
MIDGKVFERQHSRLDIDMEQWLAPKPFGISGCFRLRNEEEFMTDAVVSFLPYLDEAVLVVQPSEDRTLDVANDLASIYPKVRIVKYPFVPHPFASPGHFDAPVNSIHHFVYVSNWALSQCRYSWIAKVEGDVIALSSMRDLRKRIENAPKIMRYYGVVILNLAGKDANQISVTNPRNGGWDEAVFNNDPRLWYFVRRGKWETIERVHDNVCVGWAALHMKRCKTKFADGWNNEVWTAFNRESVRAALGNFNSSHSYPALDDPLGAECLYEATTVTEAR